MVSPSTAGPLSAAIVRDIAAFRLDDVPAEVVARARFVLLDTIGEMISASSLSHPTTRRLVELLVAPGSEPGNAPRAGRDALATRADAAFLNAALAASGLKDPLHVATTMHAPATVAGTILAMADPRRTSRDELLTAFLLGVEVACRVSCALDPAAVYRRGFHPTAVCGTFGAAVAASRCLRLSPERLGAALGLALQQAAGHVVWMSDPSDGSRPLSPAIAARNGVSAATLAAVGIGGSVAHFDDEHSVFTSFSDDPHPAELLKDWGTRFFMTEMTHKLYASCTHTHAALDALFLAVRQHNFGPDDIAGLVFRSPPASRPLITDPALRSCYAPYILAVGAVVGEVAIESVAYDRSADPAIGRLMAATTVADDFDVQPGAAAIVLVCTNGREIVGQVHAARGTLANPLSEAEVIEKYATAAGRVASPQIVKAIQDGVLGLEGVEGAGPLLALIRDIRPSRTQTERN